MRAMGAKPGRATDKTGLGERPACSLTEAARYLNPQAAKLACKRTMELFDQRFRK